MICGIHFGTKLKTKIDVIPQSRFKVTHPFRMEGSLNRVTHHKSMFNLKVSLMVKFISTITDLLEISMIIQWLKSAYKFRLIQWD